MRVNANVTKRRAAPASLQRCKFAIMQALPRRLSADLSRIWIRRVLNLSSPGVHRRCTAAVPSTAVLRFYSHCLTITLSTTHRPAHASNAAATRAALAKWRI